MDRVDIAKNNVYEGDCLHLLAQMEADSIDGILTDPPYFFDKMDDKWNRSDVNSKKYQEKSTITSLPAGMKFDPRQGKAFYAFYLQVSKEMWRVLKPGGYLLSFGPPRLYHNMASAVEDAGFWIRDLWEWIYTQNQPKAQSMNHFIDIMKGVDQETKERYKRQLSGWKTPQIRSNHEPIVMAQKPVGTTLLKNYLQNGVGLVDTNLKVGKNGDKFVSNVIVSEAGIDAVLDSHFLVPKPSKKEKGQYNDHKTVKPLALCRHLVCLITPENATVLDPFIGSGTTAVACKQTGRNYIGFDLDPKNIEICKRRISEVEFGEIPRVSHEKLTRILDKNGNLTAKKS